MICNVSFRIYRSILISDRTLKDGVVVKAIHVGRLWIEFEVKEKNDSFRGAGVV